MIILAHFISKTGFECCIEEKGGQYRAGWKSKNGTEFTFVKCRFERINKSVFGVRKYERINDWTTFSAANRQYQQMIKNHKLVNFK